MQVQGMFGITYPNMFTHSCRITTSRIQLLNLNQSILWHAGRVFFLPPVPRLLSSWVRTETVPGHCVITSISWSPHGDLLISASPVDAHLVVWDVMLGVATRISVATGGGLVAVAWSPDGRRVLTTSTMSVFRVWETRNWTCDKWTNASSRCRVRV